MNGQITLGLLMILAGLGLTCGGVLVLTRAKVSERSTPDQRIETVLVPEKNLTSEEKGYKFEKWVVEGFNPPLHIKDWRGDKQAGGNFAESSMYPDLEIELRLKDRRASFAVECKWRGSFSSHSGQKPGIEWATVKQIDRYQQFQRDRVLPVFVVIGIGGEPDHPAELYITSLDRLKYPFASAEYLARFRRPDLTKKFYYDDQKSVLR
jgi:hypothetical protein